MNEKKQPRKGRGVPSELKGVKYADLDKYGIRVYRNLRFFRIKENGFFEIKVISDKNTDLRKYQPISYNNKGTQTSVNAHVLVAEAFVPNPKSKPWVRFKDGNIMNLDPNNLHFITPKENIDMTVQKGSIKTLENTSKKCINCQNPTVKSHVCAECKRKQRHVKQKLINRRNRKRINLDKYKDALRNVERYRESHQYVIKRRAKGDSMPSISKALGVTRQRIDQIEKEALNNHSRSLRKNV